jgi:hypothetical protein
MVDGKNLRYTTIALNNRDVRKILTDESTGDGKSACHTSNSMPFNPTAAYHNLPAHFTPSGLCKSNEVSRLRELE